MDEEELDEVVELATVLEEELEVSVLATVPRGKSLRNRSNCARCSRKNLWHRSYLFHC